MSNIILKNITKSFGTAKAVDNLNLEIPDGSFTTLLGPSGCGKTTTLRMIAGLETPTGGEIWIGGKCVYSAEKGIFIPPKQRNLGLVFQSYALWPHLTVFDNIAFGLTIKKLSKQDIAARVQEIATAIRISELLARYPSELSGGQQQRVAIARVLIMKPEVLLLDEPLSNLDSKLRMDMRAELKRLHQETKATIVYVTHDQLEALTMSSDVAVMHLGKLQQWAPPMQIYRRPANLFTADFMGNPKMNNLKGTIAKTDDGIAVQAEGFSIPVAAGSAAAKRVGEAVTIGLRAEDLMVHLKAKPKTVSATVYSVLPAGSEWYVKVNLGSVQLTLTVYQEMEMDADDTVWIELNTNRVKCFDAEGMRLDLM
jgi:multiple sugar transport system ATP-binding protein